jgi:hypothetical protein
MKRREFLSFSALIPFTLARPTWAQGKKPEAKKTDTKKLTEKDILRDGQPATIANYCENPEKQPNKACPAWPTNKGYCDTCMFFNKDNSESEFKGKKYARCQLLADPAKPQFVAQKGWCATYVKKG